MSHHHQQQRQNALPAVYRQSVLSVSTASETESVGCSDVVHSRSSYQQPESSSPYFGGERSSPSSGGAMRAHGELPSSTSLLNSEDGGHMYQTHQNTSSMGSFISSAALTSPSHGYHNTPTTTNDQSGSNMTAASSASPAPYYQHQQQQQGVTRYHQVPTTTTTTTYPTTGVTHNIHHTTPGSPLQPYEGRQSVHQQAPYNNRYQQQQPQDNRNADYRSSTVPLQSMQTRAPLHDRSQLASSTPSSSTTNASESSFHSQSARVPYHQRSPQLPVPSISSNPSSPYYLSMTQEGGAHHHNQQQRFATIPPQLPHHQLHQTSTLASAPPPHPLMSGTDRQQHFSGGEQQPLRHHHHPRGGSAFHGTTHHGGGGDASTVHYPPTSSAAYGFTSPQHVPVGSGMQSVYHPPLHPPPPPATIPFHMHTHLGSGGNDAGVQFRHAPPPSVLSPASGGMMYGSTTITPPYHPRTDANGPSSAAAASSASPVGNSCFVGNIPPQISSDEIEELFARAAPASVRPIARIHKDGRYAFVTLANFVAARQAADQLHGSLLYGRNIRVEVTQNVPRYVIQQALTHHHIQQHTQQHRVPVQHMVPSPVTPPPVNVGGPNSRATTSLGGRAMPPPPSDNTDGELRSSSAQPEPAINDDSSASSPSTRQ